MNTASESVADIVSDKMKLGIMSFHHEFDNFKTEVFIGEPDVMPEDYTKNHFNPATWGMDSVAQMLRYIEATAQKMQTDDLDKIKASLEDMSVRFKSNGLNLPQIAVWCIHVLIATEKGIINNDEFNGTNFNYITP